MDPAMDCARIALTILAPAVIITHHRHKPTISTESSLSPLFLLANLLLITTLLSRTLFLSIRADDLFESAQDVDLNTLTPPSGSESVLVGDGIDVLMMGVLWLCFLFLYATTVKTADIPPEYRLSLALFPTLFTSASLLPLVIYLLDSDALDGALHEWILKSFTSFHEDKLGVVVGVITVVGNFAQAWLTAGRTCSHSKSVKDIAGLGVMMLCIAGIEAVRQRVAPGEASSSGSPGRAERGFLVSDMALGGFLIIGQAMFAGWFERRQHMSRKGSNTMCDCEHRRAKRWEVEEATFPDDEKASI